MMPNKFKKTATVTVYLTANTVGIVERLKNEPKALTFLGQMMCGANIVARLMADILLMC